VIDIQGVDSDGPTAVDDREVHIWEVFLGGTGACLDWLTDKERRRAERFHFERDRHRWVIAHTALRGILSRYLGRAPELLRFAAAIDGKPFLVTDEGPSAIRFNLTHSGDLALVAIARFEVGIDAEHTGRAIDWASLATEVFSPRERAERLPGPGRDHCLTFFDLWTLKEAYLKGRGCGLAIPLQSFELTEHAADGSCRVRIAPEWADGVDWRLSRLPAGSNYAAALACATPTDRIRRFTWRTPPATPVP